MANTKITTGVIADDAITTAKIADDQITSALVADDIALGGNPTTTTQTSGNNTTRIATTAFVTTAIAAINTSSAADDISTGDAAVTIGTSSGNITLDSPASIKLNADGGQIAFEDGSTEIGVFENSSSDFQIESKVQDKDIKFVGNDNGSAVTALTLDMSEAGHATFNAGGSFSSDLTMGGMILNPNADGGRIGLNRNPGSGAHIGDSSLRRFQINGPDTTAGDFLQIQSYNSSGTHQGNVTIQDGNLSISAAKKFHLDDLGDTYISEYSANEVEFVTGGTRRFHLSAGNGHFANGVTVGTSSFVSNSKFTVDGGDMMVQGANNSAGISDLLPGYTRGDYGVFYSTANHIYFGVGSSYVAYISGSNGTFNVSDERLKENINTLTGTLDKVKQLRGVSFTWKDTETKGTDTTIGLIAQEVETIYPELVGDGGLPKDTDGNDALKSVNYAHLTAVLIEAVKELSTKLEAAEARIKTLEDA